MSTDYPKVCPSCLQQFFRQPGEKPTRWLMRATCGKQECIQAHRKRVHQSMMPRSARMTGPRGIL